MTDLIRKILGHNRFRYIMTVFLHDEPFEGQSRVWTYEDFTTGVIYQVAEADGGKKAYRRRPTPSDQVPYPEFGFWSDLPSSPANLTLA